MNTTAKRIASSTYPFVSARFCTSPVNTVR